MKIGLGVAAAIAIGIVGSSLLKSKAPQYGQNRFQIADARKALRHEPCNRQKAIDLASLLFTSNVFSETVDFTNSFEKQCGEFQELWPLRFEALKGLGEWDKALAQVTALISAEPHDSDRYAWRGLVYETVGQWENAAADFSKAIELRPNLLDVPLNLADAQDRMGKTCDAVTTLRKVLARAGKMNGSDDVFQKMLTLNKKGKCIAGTEKEVVGQAVILFPPGAQSIMASVKMNGRHEVSMIVDTGASLVTISKSLADKMNLKPGGIVRIATANGITNGRTAMLDSIRIQGIEAKNVPVVIVDNGLSGREGLLGLSFLSKFKMEMNNAQGTLSLRSRAVGVVME